MGSNLVVAKRLNCEERDKYDLVIAATDGVKFSSNITVSSARDHMNDKNHMVFASNLGFPNKICE